jgi:hypothetical protein
MQLPRHFSKFLANISLNPTRASRIESAISNFRGFCELDKPIYIALDEWFIHGSFAHNSVTRPLDDSSEYDVDITLVLDISKLRLESMSPAALISWVATRVRNHYDTLSYLDTNPRILQKNKCVRIDYAEDFHFDVVPAYCEKKFLSSELDRTHVLIPDRKNNLWIRTNPKGFNHWVSNLNKTTGNKLSRVVKMMKRWRDYKFNSDRAPRSIVLETLVGLHIPRDAESDDILFIKTLENIEKWFQDRFFLFAYTLRNPSLDSENLAANWRNDEAELFRTKLGSALNWAIDAYDARRESTSVNLWRRILGEDFPGLSS